MNVESAKYAVTEDNRVSHAKILNVVSTNWILDLCLITHQ